MSETSHQTTVKIMFIEVLLISYSFPRKWLDIFCHCVRLTDSCAAKINRTARQVNFVDQNNGTWPLSITTTT